MFVAKNKFMTSSSKAPVAFRAFNSASSNDSITIPAHVAGDLIVIFATGPFGSITKPSASGTVPNWIDISVAPADTELGTRTAYHVATSTTTTSGRWPNTNQMQVAVLYGQGLNPIGGRAVQQGYYSPVSAPAVTLTRTDGSSRLIHFGAGHIDTFTSAFSVAGYGAVIGGASGLSSRLVVKQSTTSDGAVNLGNITTTANKWGTATVEIIN